MDHFKILSVIIAVGCFAMNFVTQGSEACAWFAAALGWIIVSGIGQDTD